MRSVGFSRKLSEAITRTSSHLCIGIDPHTDRLPPFLARELEGLGSQGYLERFTNIFLDAAKAKAPAVKFQSAFFEAYGSQGFQALQLGLKQAKRLGYVTLLDAKRGDISSTMAAYGRMAFEMMEADALTITPYMGFDVVAPLLPWLVKGRGVYLVWVSSNPEGSFLQDMPVESVGRRSTVARELFHYFEQRFVSEGVRDGLGLVLGATKVDQLDADLLQQVASTALLLPGVGPQGGMVTPRLIALLEKSPTALVPQSRRLNGLGDLTAAEELHSLTSWDDYGRFVVTRVEAANRDLDLLK